MGAHNNSLPNLLRALNERVYHVKDKVTGELKPTPRPSPGAWLRIGEIGKRLSRIVRVRVPHVERLTCQQFVDQCPAHKRALYARAAEELANRGWSQRDTKLKSFVKFEKLKFARLGPKSDPVPRLIQPRSPVYNVALGRYTRRIEAELYHALSVVWDVDELEEVVMKGMTVEEVARQLRLKWDKYDRPCALGLDAERFDQHVSVEALSWEHAVYNRIFSFCPELARLLKTQLRNIGVAFLDGHRVDYKTNGCRCSGDMNTSLGNCLIMSALVRVYCGERGVPCSLANNGDDCLVFFDRRSLSLIRGGLAEWFLEFGFTMAVEEPVFTFERCEFCQTRPVWSGREWVMVRIPDVALSKDVMGLDCRDSESYRRWIYAVGTAGLSLYGDMPVFGSLYSTMVSRGLSSRVSSSLLFADSGFARMSLKPRKHQYDGVTDACRLSFYRAFGICPDLQLDIEKHMSTLDFSGLVPDPGVFDSFSLPLADHLGNQ